MQTFNTTKHLSSKLLAGVVISAMSLATVRADYQSTVLADNPLAYYPLNLDVDTTSTASDVSGNGNNGTYINIYSGFNNVPGPSAYITNGINFDGFTTYVDLSGGGNPSLLNFSGPITMEAWVQPANTTEGPANIIAKGYDSSQDNDELVLRANGGNYYGGTYSNTNGVQGASGGQQTTGWAYVVCTYDGANWNMYVNGVLVQSNPGPVGAINFSTPWRIGTGTADGASRYFEGNISQVALYNYGLSSDQVYSHYFAGQYGTTPNESKPIITAQPQSKSNYLGGTVTFTVGVLSALPTTNLWFKGSQPLTGQTNTSLTLNNVGPGDEADYSVVIGNSNGTTNSAAASFTLLIPGASLRWAATGDTGTWDTGITSDWINQGNSQSSVFNTTDQVLFDDTVGVATNVSVNDAVSPSIITVDSSTHNFLFNGSGTITGQGSLVKKGSGTLTLNSAANFTGPVTISGGKVVAGNYAFTSVASVTITNNSTLDFGGSTLNNNKPFFISGNGVGDGGAIVNSIFELYGQVLNITLLGDTTIGGPTRWDLGSGSSVTGPYKLTVKRADSGGYGEWDGVTIAQNVGDIELSVGKLGIKNMGSTFGNPAATFTVDSGTELDFWSGSGYAKNFHVLNNGLLQILTGFSKFDANFTLEDGARFNAFYGSGNQSMNGTFTLNGIIHIVLGDANFVFTNVISGPGGFVWDAYNHQMILSANNTYSGPTVIGDGEAVALTGSGSISQSSLIFFGGNNADSVHFDVSGRSDKTLTLASGQTLGGVGAVAGNLVVSMGATLSPAGTNITLGITAGNNATGTLSATNNVTLNGTTAIKLNGSGTNDVVKAGGSITYGGMLNLVNINGAPLEAGDSFEIFDAPNRSGTFTITPTTPGPGLAWDTTQLNLGIISVISTGSSGPQISSTTVSGGNLIFSGTGGTANASYSVLSTTNLSMPLANWTSLTTNMFDGTGAFSVTNAINPSVPQQFYLLQSQ